MSVEGHAHHQMQVEESTGMSESPETMPEGNGAPARSTGTLGKALEVLDLIVDPKSQRLIPAHPDGPLLRA